MIPMIPMIPPTCSWRYSPRADSAVRSHSSGCGRGEWRGAQAPRDSTAQYTHGLTQMDRAESSTALRSLWTYGQSF
jgi:hypothetical protein